MAKETKKNTNNKSPVPTTSPTRVKSPIRENLSFSEVMQRLNDNPREKYSKAEWMNEKIYFFMHGGVLSIKNELKISTLIVSEADMAGLDYFEIK